MMLQPLRTSTYLPKESPNPAELLLACHQKIRHFSAVAVKLAHAQGAAEKEIVAAAAGLHRYFTVALPLHEADENLSLDPRLRRAVPREQLAGPAADAMLDQHRAIDELIDRLVPLWVLSKSAPRKLPEIAGEMCALSKRLSELFEAHLELEEETIFPAIERYLSESERAGIVREMQQRRQLG
jgi:hypothetical protein